MPVDGYGTRRIDDDHDADQSRLPDITSEDGEKNSKANFNVACLACRAVKTRCQNAGIGVKCSRCLRLKVTCEYREHRRGRRSTKPDKPHIAPPVVEARDPAHSTERMVEDDADPPPSTAFSEERDHVQKQQPPLSPPPVPSSSFGFYHQDVIPFSTSRISDLRNRPRSPSPARQGPDLLHPTRAHSPPQFKHSPPTITIHHPTSKPHAPQPSAGPSRLSIDRHSVAVSSPASGSCSTHSPSSAPSKRPRIRDFSVAGRLKTTKGLNDPQLQEEGVEMEDDDGWMDPVSIGMISEQDAEQLIASYFSHLNPFIALLDPSLHTTSYLRSRSSILFSSVLAVTAKYFLPHSDSTYTTLLAHSLRLLHSAMASDQCTLELIQSLSILCFWKECDDPTSWRKIGFAIRMAYELDLHTVETWSHKRGVDGEAELPEDETEAREMLNCERTWIQLCCFDRTTSSQHLKPEMIPQNLVPNVYAWAMSHTQTHPCLCDFQLAGANELSFTTSPLYHQITGSEPGLNEGMYGSMVGHARQMHMLWRAKYRTSPDPRVTLDSISRTMHHFYDLWADVKYREALFAQTHLLHQPSSHISGRVQITSLQRCIELMNATMVLLDFVSGLFEPSLVMRNSQDVFTFRTAGAGLLLTQHAPKVGPEFVMSVRHAFAKIITAAVRTSRHDKESTAYLARYFQQLLCRLNGQLSALPSRATSPTALDGAPLAAKVGKGAKGVGGRTELDAGTRTESSNVGSSNVGSGAASAAIGPGMHPPSHVASIFDHPAGGMLFDQHGYALPGDHQQPAQHIGQHHQPHPRHPESHHQSQHPPQHQHSTQHRQQQHQPTTFPPDPLVDQLMADLPGMYTTAPMNGVGTGTGIAGGVGEFGMFEPTLGDDIYWLTAWPALSGLWQSAAGGQLAPQ